MTDLGIIPILQELRVPFLNASMLSVLLLICSIAMLGRVLGKMKAREKEKLEEKVSKLEKELEEIKAKYR